MITMVKNLTLSMRGKPSMIQSTLRFYGLAVLAALVSGCASAPRLQQAFDDYEEEARLTPRITADQQIIAINATTANQKTA
jgi:hypothetical protein